MNYFNETKAHGAPGTPPATLYVEGTPIPSTKLDFEDLLWLTADFVKKNGRMPITPEYVAANNLPQPRILKRLLRGSGISYIEYCGYFGKTDHARADIDEYGLYVDRFKRLCRERGRAIRSAELCNIDNLLPCAKWLVTNCPNKNVKSYNDFIKWCGFMPSKHVFTQDEVISALQAKHKELGRQLYSSDISTPKIGFSSIVVARLFGSFNNAIKAANLDPPKIETIIKLTKAERDKKFYESLCDELRTLVQDYIQKTGLNTIRWADIESGQYGDSYHNHKTYSYYFKMYGADVKAYVASLGCRMDNNAIGHSSILKTGEYVASVLEAKTSTYLNKLGLHYNSDYFRSVKYSTFSSNTSRMDCDYAINTNNDVVYIEVAGMINPMTDDWSRQDYPSKRENNYRDSLIKKEQIFIDEGLTYLLLFPRHFSTTQYQKMISKVLQ